MERCLRCDYTLPTLNGIEENDFMTICEDCQSEINEEQEQNSEQEQGQK
jgi:hypothetical protein